MQHIIDSYSGMLLWHVRIEKYHFHPLTMWCCVNLIAFDSRYDGERENTVSLPISHARKCLYEIVKMCFVSTSMTLFSPLKARWEFSHLFECFSSDFDFFLLSHFHSCIHSVHVAGVDDDVVIDCCCFDSKAKFTTPLEKLSSNESMKLLRRKWNHF